jgi:tetratricopeptide (TPR) repeat protein
MRWFCEKRTDLRSTSHRSLRSSVVFCVVDEPLPNAADAQRSGDQYQLNSTKGYRPWTMYSSRRTPIYRMRNRESKLTLSNVSAQHGLSSIKRKVRLGPVSAPPTPISNAAPSPRLSGDYQVLYQNVDKHRRGLRDARSSLASSLDRLGEHHVRQKEYDDAMDAFTEALHEKKSILSSSSSHHVGKDDSFSLLSEPQPCEKLDDAIDEIIVTLRNMGNVHSLRGELDEAMRYYTEVTNLRASKPSGRGDPSDENTTLLSGLGGDEDNSTLMSEINEDVKALDDMFRSISFRNQESSGGTINTSRKSKPLSASQIQAENKVPSSKRRKGENVNGSFVSPESEPFRRSTSLGLPASGNELSEALHMYKSVLESYNGAHLEQHKESFNSLALRVDLLSEDLNRPDSPSSCAKGGYAMDLELAVEIYQQILTAQHEMSHTSKDGEVDKQTSANIASTLIRMGSMYYKLGNRLEELRMYTEAKETYSRAFGENHSFVAGARKNIGMVLAERGEYDEAIDQFEKAQLIYLEVHDGNSLTRDVASAISCKGNVKNRIGELDAALEHYMEALRIYKAVHEDTTDAESKEVATRDVTSTLKVVGMVHAKKGDLDVAMNYFTEAMALLRLSGVDSSPTGRETTASLLTRMASIHVKRGDLEHAMAHYKEAYELTVRNRGTTNHQDVAGILHYIGGVLHKRGEYDEAMDCYQEAIRIYHSTLGPGNPTVAGTLVMVGSIHYKRRNLDSAMMFYREALRLNRDAYGMHHPDIAPILKSIGTILTKKGEYHEAYDVFRDVLSIKCTLFGTGHAEVASAYKSLGNVHYKLGELADAERQYRHALNIFRRTRGEDHPETMAARTTIEHIRYWMKEKGQRHTEDRHSRSTGRCTTTTTADEDERSC